MSDTVSCKHGATLRFKVTLWEGARDASARRDLTGAVLSNASPVVSPASFDVPSPAMGEVFITWPDETTSNMRLGRVHPFRFAVDYPNGDREVVGDIWINIQ